MKIKTLNLILSCIYAAIITACLAFVGVVDEAELDHVQRVAAKEKAEEQNLTVEGIGNIRAMEGDVIGKIAGNVNYTTQLVIIFVVSLSGAGICLLNAAAIEAKLYVLSRKSACLLLFFILLFVITSIGLIELFNMSNIADFVMRYIYGWRGGFIWIERIFAFTTIPLLTPWLMQVFTEKKLTDAKQLRSNIIYFCTKTTSFIAAIILLSLISFNTFAFLIAVSVAVYGLFYLRKRNNISRDWIIILIVSVLCAITFAKGNVMYCARVNQTAPLFYGLTDKCKDLL